MSKKKTRQSLLLLAMLSTTLCSFGSWTDNHEINAKLLFNNGEPAAINIDATFGLSLSQQVVYNLLCLTLGVMGSGITYSGIKEFIAHNQETKSDNNQDDIHITNRMGWWKTSTGLIITVSSIIALFQYRHLNRLFNAEFIVANTT